MAIQVTNAGPEADTHPRAAHRLVPQHLVLGCRRARARPVAASGDGSVTIEHPIAGHHGADRRGRPRRRRARSCCSARTRPTWPGCTAPTRSRPYPKDGINDHVIHGAATVNPERRRHQVRVLVPVTVPRRADRRAAAAARPAAGPVRGRGARPRSATDFDQVMAQRRAEADEFYAELTPAGASADEALVLRQACAGHAVEQAAVLLRRRPLAGRRPDPAGTAGVAQERAERQVAQLRRVRHHLHAGQVGVSLVRRLGPGLPHRHPGPPGPGVRQVPADPDLPGVVPAPQRGAAGV